MPRFLGFAELVILRHVAYADGVLLRICSLCEGRNMPRFLAFAKLSILRHVATLMAFCFVLAHSVGRGMSCRFAYGILVGCTSL